MENWICYNVGEGRNAHILQIKMNSECCLLTEKDFPSLSYNIQFTASCVRVYACECVYDYNRFCWCLCAICVVQHTILLQMMTMTTEKIKYIIILRLCWLWSSFSLRPLFFLLLFLQMRWVNVVALQSLAVIRSGVTSKVSPKVMFLTTIASNGKK